MDLISTPFEAMRCSLMCRLVRAACAAGTLLLFAACASNQKTMPYDLALGHSPENDGILAIMPMGSMNPSYPDLLAESYRANWFMRTLYGKGEVTVLDNAYEDFGLALFNRLRGYDLFRRVVIVKDRAEADRLRATHLLTFRINDCYAFGSGANWNFVNWMSYESVFSVDVAVYDLVTNDRLYAQRINVNANDTSVWSTPDVRDYLRRQLLKGVTFHNAISEITF